ncbi:stage II sporulation protein P (plasmid) [Rossellomorea sp. FS2]|uniref:stage II sporulation protein P n=1 Tax=Rossellomorea sp. FS2 TaxID=3391447 RepID=UPI003A4E4526
MKKLLVGTAFSLICLTGCQSNAPASPKSDSGIDVSHTKPDTSNEYTLYHSEAKEVLPQDLYNQYQDAKVVFKFDNTVKTDTFTIDQVDIPRVSLEVSNTTENKGLAFKLHDLMETTYPGLSKGVQTQAGHQIDKNAPADAIIINLGHTLGSSEEKYAALEIVQKIIKDS